MDQSEATETEAIESNLLTLVDKPEEHQHQTNGADEAAPDQNGIHQTISDSSGEQKLSKRVELTGADIVSSTNEVSQVEATNVFEPSVTEEDGNSTEEGQLDGNDELDDPNGNVEEEEGEADHGEDDEEEMSNLFSAYKDVLDSETADETDEPLNTSIVDRMDAIEENEEELKETVTLPTNRKFTASGGSIHEVGTGGSTDSQKSGRDDAKSTENASTEDPMHETGDDRTKTEDCDVKINDQNSDASSADDEVHEKNQKDTSEIQYPDYVEECSTKLKQHYVSTYAKETPLDWFKSERKPQHRIFTDFYLTSNQLNQTVTQRLDDVIIQPGHRVLIIGDSGYGKTCLTHRILHDYGLGLLPSCVRYKILIAIDVTLWSRDYNVEDVIRDQVFKENLEADERVIDWLKDNSECVLFVIDGIDRHFDTSEHPIMKLTYGDVFPRSTVIFLSRPRGSAVIRKRCHVVHHIDKLNNKQITDFVEKLFEDDKELSGSLLADLAQDEHELYRIPLNLSLLCRLAENSVIKPGEGLPPSQTKLFDKLFLYSLRQLANDTQRAPDELAYLVTKVALHSIQDQNFSLSEHVINNQSIDNELKDKLVENGLIVKVPCKDIYYFPYRLYQEFLAAKHISLNHFRALNSEQVGVCKDEQKNELVLLFKECWNCDQPDYRFDKICVFVSALLGSDGQSFIQVFRAKFAELRFQDDRTRCKEIGYACIRENRLNTTLVSALADVVSDDDHNEINDEDNQDHQSDGVASMLENDKLGKLTISSRLQHSGLKRLCQALQTTKRLQELKMNFDGIQQENVKMLATAVGKSSNLRALSLTISIDKTSLETTEIISSLFLNQTSDLKSLSVNLTTGGTTSYHVDRPSVAENLDLFERLNLFLSRMAIFLNNHPSVEHIALGGLFLHKDCLPEISQTLISHPNLKSIHVFGQSHGAPMHRDGVLALANILGNKQFQQVTIDLNSFGGELKAPREGKKWVRFEGYTDELIMTRLLKSMQENQNLRKVKFTCTGVDCDLVDLVSDFVESCDSLKQIEFECNELDDMLLMFLGCGLLCSFSVESVHLKGEVTSGPALLQLMYTCLISESVRNVTLDCQPIMSECIEWLCENLPDLQVQTTHPVALVLKGRIDDSRADLVEKLSECATPLDLLLEIDLCA